LTILFPYRLTNYAYDEDISQLKGKLEQEGRKKFLGIQKQIELLNDIFFEFHTEIGFAVDRINSYLRQNKVGMVIISQSQANLINEVNVMALQNLIATSETPFMIVPRENNAEVSSQ
jgi:hypothetical protein